MWQLDFTTAQFGSTPLDPAMPTASAYGLELATWVAQALLAQGLRTNYPVSDGKGWVLDYIDPQGHAYTVRCACLQPPADSPHTGAHWLVAIQAQLTPYEQLCGIRRNDTVAQLGTLVRQALQAQHIAIAPLASR